MTPIRNLYPVEFPRPAGLGRKQHVRHSRALAVGLHPRGPGGRFPLAGRFGHGQPAGLGRVSRRVQLLSRARAETGRDRLRPFSDPRAAEGGEQPVYFAGQFYGSGSVFYLGSGEMWRLRAVDETYFEQFYTKLIRHVSQGRLLRGSSRGVLLVGQDRYLLGNTVEVRAQLTNARLEPLAVPSVELQVFAPDGKVQTSKLRPDPTRQGTYLGQFPVTEEGTYRLELPVPESDNERLIRRIQVKLPDLERENPQRNDALLSQIAKADRGKILRRRGCDFPRQIAAGRTTEGPHQHDHPNRAPDPQWEETWLRWMMIALCGLLCLEWLIRRLVKLA